MAFTCWSSCFFIWSAFTCRQPGLSPLHQVMRMSMTMTMTMRHHEYDAYAKTRLLRSITLGCQHRYVLSAEAHATCHVAVQQLQ